MTAILSHTIMHGKAVGSLSPGIEDVNEHNTNWEIFEDFELALVIGAAEKEVFWKVGQLWSHQRAHFSMHSGTRVSSHLMRVLFSWGLLCEEGCGVTGAWKLVSLALQGLQDTWWSPFFFVFIQSLYFFIIFVTPGFVFHMMFWVLSGQAKKVIFVSPCGPLCVLAFSLGRLPCFTLFLKYWLSARLLHLLRVTHSLLKIGNWILVFYINMISSSFRQCEKLSLYFRMHEN